ncbi:MAG: NnrS family protein [Gammaproteobacteria bacterium]
MSSSSPSSDARLAVLELGFRPFFIGAGAYAVIAMCAWALVRAGGLALPASPLSPSEWHAHEMLFGYALAVVAGFLLTAVANWTGAGTLAGRGLAGLAALWVAARVCCVAGIAAPHAAALFDLAFGIALLAAIAVPLVRHRQRRQAGVLAKLALLIGANALFYLGALGVVGQGVRWALDGALWLLVALVLTIGARVLPGFIERGVAETISLRQPGWMTVANLLLFTALFATDLFFAHRATLGGLAAALFVLNGARLALWFTPGILARPLLWSLSGAFVFIEAGFALLALWAFADVPRSLAVHAFGVGGIGLATLAMMSRVALGHTGRSIHAPPRVMSLAFGLLCGAVLARVGVPLLAPAHYAAAVLLAQALWIAAFAIFVVIYVPMLTAPRADAG